MSLIYRIGILLEQGEIGGSKHGFPSRKFVCGKWGISKKRRVSWVHLTCVFSVENCF